ncbi:MAG: sigma-54 dependent transcriptional regulator [Rickettsiales bacterium]
MRILLVGKKNGPTQQAATLAEKQGAATMFAGSVGEALALLRGGHVIELVMADVAGDVPGLINGMVAERLTVPVVAFGTEDDAPAAVRAIKAGAREYVPLPPDEEIIAALLGDLSEDKQKEVVFVSPKMKALFDLCHRIAASNATALITGESGAGKEIAARYIHRHSGRKDKPMVAVNCAAIPENLLETELFGHEKGAFTGATSRRIGKFEEADGSTLLLDEVSEMALPLQAKLLRVVQEREIDRVGGKSGVKIDVRIVATSNRNLWEYVQAGHFREDLYYRLNVIHLRIPPLREREEDVPLLADYFLARYAAMNGSRVNRFSDEARAKLAAHAWPGNVRELENTIHRAVLLASGTDVRPEDVVFAGPGAALNESLSHRPVSPPSGTEESFSDSSVKKSPNMVGKTVAEAERELILQTMEHCYGNRTKAADILGISIRTLRNKLNEYEGAA